MTIRQAIEGLEDLLGNGPYFSPEYRRKAIELGIEALNRLNLQRQYPENVICVMLPGETEEKDEVRK